MLSDMALVKYAQIGLKWSPARVNRAQYINIPREIDRLPTAVGCPQGHPSLGHTHPCVRDQIGFLLGPFTFGNNDGT